MECMAVDHDRYITVETRLGIIEPRLEALATEHYDLTHSIMDTSSAARVAYLEERIAEFEAEVAALTAASTDT